MGRVFDYGCKCSLAVFGVAAFFVISAMLSSPGTANSRSAPSVTMVQVAKGDRLPLLGPTLSAKEQTAKAQPAKGLTATSAKFGCDPAFSTVADPRHAYYYGRCMA
jgi:hypothetical protein